MSMDPSNEDLVGALVRVSDGHEFSLGFGNCRVGRQKGADLRLSDRTVSRHHADITYESGRYVLYDNSSNGTWINGSMVVGAQALRDGDMVKLGALEFRFRWVPRSRGAGELPGGDTRVSGAATLRIKGGRAKGRPGLLRRVMKIVLAVVLLAAVAAAVTYFFFPEIAEPWVDGLRQLVGFGAPTG